MWCRKDIISLKLKFVDKTSNTARVKVANIRAYKEYFILKCKDSIINSGLNKTIIETH